jgi:hypothetical protein
VLKTKIFRKKKLYRKESEKELFKGKEKSGQKNISFSENRITYQL